MNRPRPRPLGFRPWRPLDPRSRDGEREGVLRLDPHLLRERRSSPGPRLHDRRRRRAHALAPSARREGVVPHRHGRARSEDHAHRRGERRHPAGVVRQARRRGLEAPLGAPEHRERRLHPHDGEASHRPRPGVRPGPLRQGRDLQGRLRGPVLRGLRGVQAPGELLDGEGEFAGQKLCPIHKKPVEILKEENYFFKLSSTAPSSSSTTRRTRASSSPSPRATRS